MSNTIAKEDIDILINLELDTPHKSSEPCQPPEAVECLNEALFRVFFQWPCEHFLGGRAKCLFHKDMIVEFSSAHWLNMVACARCDATVGKVTRVEKI
jgi:hypothetical protein